MFAPETEVRFLSNVEFDVNFTNVRDFNTREEETQYFIGKTKFYYPTCAVQDVFGYSGFVIAPINDGMSIDSYYDCNYIMYRNSEISNKWFYAALGTPQPLSKKACRIPYKIDLWRTWFMDCTIGECYVEREHVNDDTVGKWLKPESVDTGEYVAVATGQEKLGYDLTEQLDNRSCIVVVNSFAPDTDGAGDGYEISYTDAASTGRYILPSMAPKYVGGFLCGGIYQGAMFAAFPFEVTNVSKVVGLVNAYLKNMVINGQIDRVIGIFMCPFWICKQVAGKLDVADVENTNLPVSFPITANPSPTTFGGYVPENNKLFTGQFNYFIIDNGAGTQEEYQYEYFNRKKDGGLPFTIYGQLSEAPSIRLTPDSYKCPALSTGRLNNLYSIDLSGFPSGSYSYSDVANSWNGRTLQRMVSYLSDQWSLSKLRVDASKARFDAVKNVASAGIDFFTGKLTSPKSKNSPPPHPGRVATDLMGVGIDSLYGFASADWPIEDEEFRIAQNEAAYADSLRIPNIVKGNANGSISYPLGYLTFTQYRMQVQEQYARRIDKYLSAFGYTIDEIKVPNLKGRAKWNYVKTANAVVNGNVPEEAKAFIAGVINTGIRLWHPGSIWLDYSQKNNIV